MGSGKGNPEFWVAVVKPGRVLFELSFHDEDIARQAINVPSRSCRSRPASSHVRRGSEWQGKGPGRTRDADLVDELRTQRKSCSTCASRTPPASSRTPPHEAGRRRSPDAHRALGAREIASRIAGEAEWRAPMASTTEAPATNARKVREGIVVSDEMDKTAVVETVDRVRHRRYAKTVQRTRSSTPRRGERRSTSATGSASRRPVRCRRTSAGVSSRSWSGP